MSTHGGAMITPALDPNVRYDEKAFQKASNVADEKKVKHDNPATADIEQANDATNIISDRDLLRRIDYRFVPIMTSIYLVFFVGRMQMTDFSRHTLQENLGVGFVKHFFAEATFYLSLQAWLYVPYSPCYWVRPHVRCPLYLLLNGVIVLSHMFVYNYYVYILLQVLQGACALNLILASTEVIGTWYTPAEMFSRQVLFVGIALPTQFLGCSLLSSLARHLDGVHGFSAQRWVFALESCAWLILAACALGTLDECPDVAGKMRPEDRELACRRRDEAVERLNMLIANGPPIEWYRKVLILVAVVIFVVCGTYIWMLLSRLSDV